MNWSERMIIMEKDFNSLIDNVVKLNKTLARDHMEIKQLMRIYTVNPISDYLVQDAYLGGYVPHQIQETPKKKHRIKRTCFIKGVI